MAIEGTVFRCIFSRKLKLMDSFIAQKIVRMTFFNECCAREFLFTKESVYFRRIDCFLGSGSYRQNHVFWTKACFSVYITYCSIHFTWFALLNYQRFDDSAWSTLIWAILNRPKISDNAWNLWKINVLILF